MDVRRRARDIDFTDLASLTASTVAASRRAPAAVPLQRLAAAPPATAIEAASGDDLGVVADTGLWDAAAFERQDAPAPTRLGVSGPYDAPIPTVSLPLPMGRFASSHSHADASLSTSSAAPLPAVADTDDQRLYNVYRLPKRPDGTTNATGCSHCPTPRCLCRAFASELEDAIARCTLQRETSVSGRRDLCAKSILPPFVARMCTLMRLTAQDTFFDFGSGNGSVLFQVAMLTGARCVGVELNARNAELSRRLWADLRPRLEALCGGRRMPEVEIIEGDCCAYLSHFMSPLAAPPASISAAHSGSQGPLAVMVDVHGAPRVVPPLPSLPGAGSSSRSSSRSVRGDGGATPTAHRARGGGAAGRGARGGRSLFTPLQTDDEMSANSIGSLGAAAGIASVHLSVGAGAIPTNGLMKPLPVPADAESTTTAVDFAAPSSDPLLGSAITANNSGSSSSSNDEAALYGVLGAALRSSHCAIWTANLLMPRSVTQFMAECFRLLPAGARIMALDDLYPHRRSAARARDPDAMAAFTMSDHMWTPETVEWTPFEGPFHRYVRNAHSTV